MGFCGLPLPLHLFPWVVCRRFGSSPPYCTTFEAVCQGVLQKFLKKFLRGWCKWPRFCAYIRKEKFSRPVLVAYNQFQAVTGANGRGLCGQMVTGTGQNDGAGRVQMVYFIVIFGLFVHFAMVCMHKSTPFAPLFVVHFAQMLRNEGAK